MNQFRNKDPNVSQQTLSPGIPNPVTPPTPDGFFAPSAQLSPLESSDTIRLPILPIKQEQDTAPIRRTELEQQQLTHLVSGEDCLSPSTEPVAAVTPDRKPKITYYTNNGNLATIELLTCAIIQHLRECKVIPRFVVVSSELASKLIKDMEDLYGEETFNGTIPFLAHQMKIQHISIEFSSKMAEDTVLCIAGLHN